MEHLKNRVNAMVEGLAELSRITGLENMSKATHIDLAAMIERMASNQTVAANLPRIREIEVQFGKAGVGNIIERIGKDISIQYAAQAIEWAWLWQNL